MLRLLRVVSSGKLVPAKVESVGLGGTINILFVCTECSMRKVNFQGSTVVEGSKRTVIGLALAVVLFICGHGFAQFNQTLDQYFGISALSKNRYYDIINPLTAEILNEMCEEEKQMQALPEENLGS